MHTVKGKGYAFAEGDAGVASTWAGAWVARLTTSRSSSAAKAAPARLAASTTVIHPVLRIVSPSFDPDLDPLVFARDLEVSYRVWSPTEGYPRNPWYRDFHTFDHDWGFRQSRVTDHSGGRKEPYQPQRALAASKPKYGGAGERTAAPPPACRPPKPSST